MAETDFLEKLASDLKTACIQSIELGKRIENILVETNKGFEKQGKVTKKIALRMFKKNAGMKIEEWIQYASSTIPELEKFSSAVENGDIEVQNQIKPNLLEYKEKLRHLSDYYEKTADLVKKFLKDPEELKNSLEGLNNSRKRIDLFIQVIQLIEKET